MCRRTGVPLCGSPKCPVLKRGYPPGQHGPIQRRRRITPYATQLLEKQKLRHYYGVLERQFRNYFVKARKSRGRTGESLLQLLESRLDTVVYRLGFAPTLPAARQLVNHGHILLNGRKADIPSHGVSPGSEISVRQKSREMPLIIESVDTPREIPPYLDLDRENFKGRLVRLPSREEVPVPVDENLVVEFYSR